MTTKLAGKLANLLPRLLVMLLILQKSLPWSLFILLILQKSLTPHCIDNLQNSLPRVVILLFLQKKITENLLIILLILQNSLPQLLILLIYKRSVWLLLLYMQLHAYSFPTVIEFCPTRMALKPMQLCKKTGHGKGYLTLIPEPCIGNTPVWLDDIHLCMR